MNAYSIAELGNDISQKLREMHLGNNNELVIRVDDKLFKQIDEELYYKQNPDGKDFIPSDDVIVLKYTNFDLKFLNNG